MSIKEIKTKGRAAFKSNYWRCVIAAILLILLVGGAAASGASNAQDAADTQSITDAVNNLSKEQLRTLAAVLISGSVVLCLVSIVLKVFLFNPLKVGCYRFFLKNTDDTSSTLGVIKEGFGGYGHVFGFTQK